MPRPSNLAKLKSADLTAWERIAVGKALVGKPLPPRLAAVRRQPPFSTVTVADYIRDDAKADRLIEMLGLGAKSARELDDFLVETITSDPSYVSPKETVRATVVRRKSLPRNTVRQLLGKSDFFASAKLTVAEASARAMDHMMGLGSTHMPGTIGMSGIQYWDFGCRIYGLGGYKAKGENETRLELGLPMNQGRMAHDFFLYRARTSSPFHGFCKELVETVKEDLWSFFTDGRGFAREGALMPKILLLPGPVRLALAVLYPRGTDLLADLAEEHGGVHFLKGRVSDRVVALKLFLENRGDRAGHPFPIDRIEAGGFHYAADEVARIAAVLSEVTVHAGYVFSGNLNVQRRRVIELHRLALSRTGSVTLADLVDEYNALGVEPAKIDEAKADQALYRFNSLRDEVVAACLPLGIAPAPQPA